MTPRERVLATLRHEEPDRVPIVLGVSNATGIKALCSISCIPRRATAVTGGTGASRRYARLATTKVDGGRVVRATPPISPLVAGGPRIADLLKPGQQIAKH
jgi:hypothetical protein